MLFPWACRGPILNLSRATPEAFLSFSWASPGQLLDFPWASSWASPGLSWAFLGSLVPLFLLPIQVLYTTHIQKLDSISE